MRGARVKFSADQTTQDYSGGTALAWNAEVFDSNTIHDNSTNPSRLTIPKGYTKARIEAGVYLTNVTANSAPTLTIRKNGTAIVPDSTGNNPSTTWGTTISTGVIGCSPGDYFDAFVQLTDTSVTLDSARSFMSIELIS